MSNTDCTRYDARGITKRFTASLTGRTERGPDHAPDRRVPRRHSYDVDSPQANRWTKIGDGSIGHGIAHREALLDAASELYHQHWKDYPASAVRENKNSLAIAQDAFDRLGDQVAPIGKAATLRQEIASLTEWLARAGERVQRSDVTVLKALLKHLDFKTGRLFPSIDTVAATAGCHRNTAIKALARLKGHGFFDWVRRSIATDNEGQFAPQREQTSNAYFFEHRVAMAKEVYLRFKQILDSKLRRLGRVPAAIAAATASSTPPGADALALRAAVQSFGASVSNASP